MARLQGQADPRRCGAVRCHEEGCQLRPIPGGRCPGLDAEASEADRLLQLRLRAGDAEESGRVPGRYPWGEPRGIYKKLRIPRDADVYDEVADDPAVKRLYLDRVADTFGPSTAVRAAQLIGDSITSGSDLRDSVEEEDARAKRTELTRADLEQVFGPLMDWQWEWVLTRFGGK